MCQLADGRRGRPVGCAAVAPLRFFKDPQFDFETRIALGGASYRAAEVGEVLATIGRIKDGDAEAWFREWTATGERVLAAAEAAEAAGHRLSARDAFLRACAYLFTATGSLDGTDDPDRLLPAWRRHREAWERFGALCDPAIERVAIPYEGTELVGYVFRPREGGRRPAIVLNNGSDGPVNAMWIQGGAAAVARGYVAIAFDGPGQGQALLEQGIPFRPDWEAVIAPVLDVLLARDDVDPARVALHGISQAGYWAPRAAAFEPRVGAVVADPGVMDVSTSWTDHLPQSLRRALDEGREERFDKNLALGLRFNRLGRRELAFRMRPYGTDDPYEAFRMVREYHLRDVAGRIACPVLITDPDDEQFWPGQSRELADAIGANATLIRFTAEEGGNWHCEPMTPGLRDQRVFDWLDGTLGAGAGNG
jgi:hypothetical protein